ncbi:MAG: glycosyltransferase family 4 protein [Chlamydiia bacterium]|nr:glycosyltransferase family 4 protein [Chlamydiia bacterium]
MKIVVPYNEILPAHKAHDVYLFNFCHNLASSSHTVELLCGKGTPCFQTLCRHYDLSSSNALQIKCLPIMRKNNLMGLSWNLPFFANSQRHLLKTKPDIVHFSVVKQAAYHLKKRIKGIHYIYEAHELALFAHRDISQEKRVLEQVDTIVVTTKALKEALLTTPYFIQRPIVVIPLAVNVQPLLPPKTTQPLTLGYIGQLYQGQGIETLLTALRKISPWRLEVIGGKKEEITYYQRLSHKLGIENRVIFHGFISPSEIPKYARNCHAFVAPFGGAGRMPYVAHTKLYEYARFGRPVVAPNFPVTREHFKEEYGVLFYTPESSESLSRSLQKLLHKSTLNRLQEEILFYQNCFTWAERCNLYHQLLDHRATRNNVFVKI